MNFGARIIAATLVSALASAILAGCGESGGLNIGGPTPGGTDNGDEEFTIVLLVFHGANRVEAAEYFKKNTEASTKWKSLRTVAKDSTSELQWGKYRTVEAAHVDLERARKFKTPGTGECIYAKAMVIPMPAAKVGPPEWDLENTTKGMFTVNVAVFFDVPEAGYFGRRKLAADYCRQLRSEGYEAYYFHDGTRSAVCIGTFGQEAVRQTPPNLAPVAFNPRAEQYEILDPQMDKIKHKFPKMAVNGREELLSTFDTVAGKWVKAPAESCVVVIPRKGNANSLDRPGNP